MKTVLLTYLLADTSLLTVTPYPVGSLDIGFSPTPLHHTQKDLETNLPSLNMSPPADGKLPRESGTARVAGSAVAGITELAIFHPVVSRAVIVAVDVLRG